MASVILQGTAFLIILIIFFTVWFVYSANEANRLNALVMAYKPKEY